MAHSTIIRTPGSTPLPERTVGELVAELPARSRVFQRHHIDFCCQGGRTLREACESKGLDTETIAAEIEAVSHCRDAGDGPVNPAELPLDALAGYIVERHHHYLRNELPRLHTMAERVAKVHGGHTPSLIEVRDVFTEMAAELGQHMMKEEQVLFPSITAMVRENQTPMPLDGPIACMLQEHDDAGEALARLRELTSNYTPPESACNTYRALFAGLADLDKDLKVHIHLENHILFPGAQRHAEAGGRS